MIRLWLDDARPAPEGWRWVKTAEQAKVLLLTGQVGKMSLDRDLDLPACPTCDYKCGLRDNGQCEHGCECHSAGDETGEHLVEWMVRWGCWPREKPVVHSTNPDGAEKMSALIDTHFPRT